MKKKILLAVWLTLIFSCSIQQSMTTSFANVHLIIWDAENSLGNQEGLLRQLKDRFPHFARLSGTRPENAIPRIEALFDEVGEDDLCLFLIVSGSWVFHLSSEWNLWFPDLWRELECEGKILIADAPWGEEFINPVKMKKPNTIWVINGMIENLRRKLPGAFSVASCRFDEMNLISRGIDGKNKLPLFSWYFLTALCDGSENPDLVRVLEKASELTRTAMERGVLSRVETVLFFKQSQITQEEYFSFPHPHLWNGLAKEIIIGVNR